MKFLITGTAGFIGFHVAKSLLDSGEKVIGVDNFNDYYDVVLKENRSKILRENSNFIELRNSIENLNFIREVFETYEPDFVIHLAAQAGVRFSIEKPEAYIQSNIVGTFKLLEAAKLIQPKHLLLASTSSAYGANLEMPYVENQKTDHQVSIYAATKKSMEVLSHSYSHLYSMPITVFRFFTVYGPYGRPDMAPHKFTSKILANEPIDVYNHGKMERDFTYVEDLVKAILNLAYCIPDSKISSNLDYSCSPVAPWRVINIGNANPIKLLDFISAIEQALGIKAKKNYMPMQPGDVVSTWANVSLLKELTGYVPNTKLSDGISKFILWYRSYYGNNY